MRQQDLAEQVSAVGEIGLGAHQRAEDCERLVEIPLEIEDRREGVPRLDVVGVRGELGPQRLARLRRAAPASCR